MPPRARFAPFVYALAATLPLLASAQDVQSEEILALERAALDRWSNGDPEGYLETYAADVTYFDPTTARRVDGIEAMRAMLLPLKGKFKLARYEIVAPVVLRRESIAVLSYDLLATVPSRTATRS